METTFFSWYFTEIPKKIYRIWTNYLWFFQRFLSMPLLLRTFFAPWKRSYFVSSSKGINLGEWFGNFIFNTFSRFIGMFLRLIVLLIGTLIEIIVGIGGIVSFVLWIAFPFLLIFSFIKGIMVI
ncbi:MAG TPA: hypothetical protein PLL80_00845 [Candidatus Pacearchaeota archaeon]|nr:hypothetical protein [Candidatus Pacearchaeota archaeon]HOK94075.1 hypothetical protein [Candidatus Pacearchaeota archaeon]HPO75146.1 hypothetical protein [Candidatus Pacearchaeota archaeon]